MQLEGKMCQPTERCTGKPPSRTVPTNTVVGLQTPTQTNMLPHARAEAFTQRKTQKTQKPDMFKSNQQQQPSHRGISKHIK